MMIMTKVHHAARSIPRPVMALTALAFATWTPALAFSQPANGVVVTNLTGMGKGAHDVPASGDNISADTRAQANETDVGAPNASIAQDEAAADIEPADNDEWGWLKVIVAGLVGAAGVLATQWITARTNRQIAREQATISRSAVQVAQDAAKASALGASAAVESAGAAREGAAVARKNADNLGVHAVARLRQDWINTVRDELSKLHSLLANYRPLPTMATVAQIAAHGDQQREANQRKAKLALLLNPQEIASFNLSLSIRHLENPMLSSADRAPAHARPPSGPGQPSSFWAGKAPGQRKHGPWSRHKRRIRRSGSWSPCRPTRCTGAPRRMDALPCLRNPVSSMTSTASSVPRCSTA